MLRLERQTRNQRQQLCVEGHRRQTSHLIFRLHVLPFLLLLDVVYWCTCAVLYSAFTANKLIQIGCQHWRRAILKVTRWQQQKTVQDSYAYS